jgi:hypothetical protein
MTATTTMSDLEILEALNRKERKGQYTDIDARREGAVAVRGGNDLCAARRRAWRRALH